eukprot:6256560-Alexandrium_andersonii.AAC.1
MSKVMLSVCACFLEYTFEFVGFSTWARKKRLRFRNRASLVYIGRYVDDVLMYSYAMCPKCLGQLLDVIYGSRIVFEPEPDALWDVPGLHAFRWVDIVWLSDWNGLSLYHHNPNELWVWTGLEVHHKKHRSKYYAGDRSRLVLRQLCSELSGRRA